MGRETFVSLDDDGNLIMVTENDGWSMKRGMETVERQVTLEDLEGGKYYEAAKQLLASAKK